MAKLLQEKQAEIKSKMDKINAIFDAAGDEDLPKDKRGEVKSLHQEVADIEAEVKEMLEAANIRTANDARRKSWNEPANSGGHDNGGEPGRTERGQRRSIGATFVNDAAHKAWVAELTKSGPVPSKARISSPPVEIKNLITSADGSGGAFIRPDYDADVPLPFRVLTLRDVITVGQTGSDMVEYVRQNGRTNNAAPVADATATAGNSGLKPESAISFEVVQAAVKTIPTWIPATRNVLSDAAQLRSLIDSELRQFVDEELEDQIAGGDGTGQNFLGLMNTPGLTPQAFATDLLTTTRKARTAAKIQGRAIPNAYLMNPLDWEALDLTQDAEKQYYFGGPSVLGNPRLWGLPVIECEAIPQGWAFTGDLRLAKVWDRMQATIMMSDSHADFFIRNMIAVLCELRAAFGVKRPAGIVKIDLTAG